MTAKKGLVVTPEDFSGVDWVTKLQELKLNTIGIHSGGGSNHDIFERLGPYADARFRERVRAAKLACEYELHAADALLPRQLFATRPELFAMNYITGKRNPYLSWCPSNKDTLEYLRRGARDLAGKLPSSTHRYYFWGTDAVNASCHCPSCSEYSLADLNMASVNAIQAGLRDADPAAQSAFLAYLNCSEPSERIKPAPGVFLEFAPIRRCYLHAIDDPSCEINRKFYHDLQRLLEVFDPAQSHILEYHMDSSYFSRYNKPAVKVVFSEKILRRDLEAYTALGIRNFTSFAVYMDGEYFKNYGDEDLVAYAKILNEHL